MNVRRDSNRFGPPLARLFPPGTTPRPFEAPLLVNCGTPLPGLAPAVQGDALANPPAPPPPPPPLTHDRGVAGLAEAPEAPGAYLYPARPPGAGGAGAAFARNCAEAALPARLIHGLMA